MKPNHPAVLPLKIRVGVRCLLAWYVAMGLRFAGAEESGVGPSKHGFERRGFYLHGCWVMEYPFSVRSWEREDFAQMFKFLRHLGYTTVMLWPTPETAPMPLSPEDAATLRNYNQVIGDAKTTGLECWLTYCPNVISKGEVRSLSWKDRSLYASTEVIRLSDESVAASYLKHRQSVLQIFDQADAYVVIDGDPGGYPEAPIEEYLRILQSDQEAVPGKCIIPWLWSGWGRDSANNFWGVPVGPKVAASLDGLKKKMTGNWELLPGRSHREGWANGREVVAETEKAGLMARSTIMCYEAIEFEPTPPAAVLQFDIIRQVLKQEGQLSSAARGVFGNCENAVLILPNLYYFARGAADLGYLDKPEPDVLEDFARELGDTEGVLIPAWSCLKLKLSDLPPDLANKVGALHLDTDFARSIPGGPQRYLEIISAQVKSRRQLLEAADEHPGTPSEAAASLAKGANALLSWWQVHRYVGPGRKGDPFDWSFVLGSELAICRNHAKQCVKNGPDVIEMAADLIALEKIISRGAAAELLKQLASER